MPRMCALIQGGVHGPRMRHVAHSRMRSPKNGFTWRTSFVASGLARGTQSWRGAAGVRGGSKGWTSGEQTEKEH